ncbi:serine hydrolase domain-containing protein [Flagellimonas myxillae]|uniref:serine hydrolase domain-containing protein n=1 Tax=Flagellimonas myxillae TaxID=2942214 RepID=UPI00201EBE50|nr:serine hydrolase domain-containing protein [Muricauda myxillae]MCL6268114.1 beta-lactamase family protein [Muricauda myxillae]
MRTLLSNIKKWFSNSGAKLPKDLEGLEKIETIFQSLAVDESIPGMGVAVFKKGRQLLQKGYGHANLERKLAVAPERTLFRIASISKCITGLALAKMVEEGLLTLDDSFQKHVTYFPNKEFDFTLRQLAGHTAGIRGYRGKEFALNKELSIRDSLQIFQDDPLQFEPGKGYLYNSFDYVLLSLAMQEASGISFEDYVQNKVLEPLGMIHTLSPAQVRGNPNFLASQKLQMAEFYTKTRSGFKQATPVNNQYKLAGGGYLSTVSDMGKLGQAILEGKLVSTGLLKEVLTAQKVIGDSTYYGLGFQVSQDAQGRPFVGHVGNSVGAYSNLFVYPEEEIVFACLINCTDPKVQGQLDSLLEFLHTNVI